MIDSLSEVEGSIIDVKTELEELDTELQNLHWEVFDKVQDNFNNLHSEIDNLVGLFDDADVVDDKGMFSKEALSNLGLLTQKYELAQYQSSQYAKEIEKLNQDYLDGKYSLLEYQEKLASLNESQWDSINAAEQAKDAMMELHEQRVDKIIEGIEEEKEAYNELIEAQLEAIETEGKLNDRKDTIDEKTAAVAKIQRQIDALKGDNSLSAKAQRAKLEEELAELQKDLDDTIHDYSVEAQKEALNKQNEQFAESKDAEIEVLEETLEDEEKLIADSFNTVKKNASTVGQQIENIAKQHGVAVSDALTTSWKSGETAIASYGETLTVNSSAFIANIIGVENEVLSLQTQADNTAKSLVTAFSTKTDTLVSELVDSYNSVGNVYNMTEALRSSLSTTLESGYDVSGITNALNAIKQAAIETKQELDKVGGDVEKPSLSPDKYHIIDENGNEITVGGGAFADAQSAQNVIDGWGKQGQWKVLPIDEYDFDKYASGVHNLDKDKIAWTQDGGGELIVSPSRDAILTPLKKGDTVLTRAQTDNIFDWSKINPDVLVPDFVRNSVINNMPQITPREVNPTMNIHYDSLVTVNGDVNDLKNLTNQMEKISHNQIVDYNKSLNNATNYGSSMSKWGHKKMV